MKKVLFTVVAMFLLMVWPGGAIWVTFFPKIIGGGIAESFLYPIYGGIILLSGLVVGCTVYVCDEIKSLRREIEKESNTPFNEKATEE